MGISSEVMQFILAAKDNASGTVRKVNTELNTLGGAGAKAAGPLGKLSAVTGGLVSPATLAIGAAAAVTAGLNAAANAASDNEESLNKLRVVYGPAADDLEDWADRSATNLGASNTAALEALGTFGNLFTAMGIGREPAADMSQDLVQLAADLASFNNIDPSEVFVKLRAGIVGEAEPLRTLGVNISAVRTQEKALELGLVSAGETLTAQAKAQANYAIILDDTKNAQGDYARTSDSLANAQRSLGAEIDDLAVAAGEAALPALTDLVVFLRDEGVPTLEKFTALLDVSNENSADGIPILEQVEDGLNAVAQNLLYVSDNLRFQENDIRQWAETTGQSYTDARAELKAYADEHGVSFGEAADALAANETAVSDALDRNMAKSGQWRRTIAEQAAGAAEDFDAATDDMVEDAEATPGEIAQAIMDGREEWKDSWRSMKTAAKEEMEEGKRVTTALARLQSQELIEGLQSKDEARRRWAEQTRLDLINALTIDGYNLGGMLVNGFVLGITENQWRAQSAAAGLAQLVKDIFPQSEPKDPSSPFRGSTHWGSDFVRMIADDMNRESGALSGALAGVTPGTLPGPTRGGRGGSGGSEGITVIFQSTYPPTPSQAEDLARQLLPAFERERRRQGLVN